MNRITRQRISTSQRISHSARLFGLSFPVRLEPAIFSIAANLASDYDGGFWEFWKLSNGGFYMAPVSDAPFSVSADNGYEGYMGADALGITACLYAYSHLSFGDGNFAGTCAEQYHWLREFALDHAEAGSILRAID